MHWDAGARFAMECFIEKWGIHMKRIIFIAAFFILMSVMPVAANAATAGTMEYNETAGRMQFYDGTQWYYFAAGLPGGSCSVPGQMDYDTLLSSYKTCNGSNWLYVGGLPTLSLCSQAGTMDYISSTFMVCNGLLWVNIKGVVATS
jgi:hypothetical protein